MKRLLTFVALAVISTVLSAQTPKNVKYRFVEASDLNLIGKIIEDTPNPYHRVDRYVRKARGRLYTSGTRDDRGG